MKQFLVRFYHEAKDKLTCYLGLLIASAAEIQAEWPTVVSQLPHWSWLVTVEHHVLVILGLLVIYARVRRKLKDAGLRVP
jgi:hypothetical protein